MTRPLAYEPRHALNAICPYFTMFPLEYPLRVLQKHKRDLPVVMDPFCGRGTTLYAARTLGLEARGIDSSPVAVAVAQAKLSRACAEDALSLAKKYLAENDAGDVPQSEFFEWAYHPDTLRQVCAIRAGLLREQSLSDSVVLLRASMLGCLHGPQSKRPENSAYFSNQMPRTFSSKPGYSVEYWKARGLVPRRVDVLAVLSRKLSRLNPPQSVLGSSVADVRLGDSRRAADLPAAFRDFSVVVTSPPYYGMKTYVEDQWLRSWFLGGPAEPAYGEAVQLCHNGQDAFARSLGQVWKNMARTRADQLDMYVRFGIIPSLRVDAKALMRASLEDSGVRWKEVSVRSAKTAEAGKRQATHMAAGSAAAVEYDFHLKRI